MNNSELTTKKILESNVDYLQKAEKTIKVVSAVLENNLTAKENKTLSEALTIITSQLKSLQDEIQKESKEAQ